jgi:release factor glutamine methyltransferase
MLRASASASASAHETRTLGHLLACIAPLLGDASEPQDLAAAFFDRPRHWPRLNAGLEVSAAQWDAMLNAARKRARGAPLQYAAGKANFRALTLCVDERVLIPRPETELLVDLVLSRAPAGGTAVDVGTGSGAIAIALATEGSFDRVVGTDISTDALELARVNARTCGAAVEFFAGDLLRFEQGRMPVAAAGLAAVVSNPPYVAFEEARHLPASVRDWEPPLALFSAHGGLAHTAGLVAQAASMLQDGGLLALEVDARRAFPVADLVARDARYEQVTVELDLTGRERFVLALRRRRSRND